MIEYKYSVLMAIYAKDLPVYVVTAVESMLSQTIPPEEYIIVVDGPITDELKTVILKYGENKELFTIIWLNENKGLANALNIGLKHCRNELVARMDADDISRPNRCERELECFKNCPKLVICGCNVDEFYESPNNIKTSRIVPQDYQSIRKFMKKRQPFNHPTVMYKKSKVLECGGYPYLKRKEDFDLFSRMLQKGCYALNINESLYLYRVNKANYARRKSKTNLKSAIYVYRQHLNRKGCSLWDFIIISCAEICFYILPIEVVKILSNNILRKNIAIHKQ